MSQGQSSVNLEKLWACLSHAKQEINESRGGVLIVIVDLAYGGSNKMLET